MSARTLLVAAAAGFLLAAPARAQTTTDAQTPTETTRTDTTTTITPSGSTTTTTVQTTAAPPAAVPPKQTIPMLDERTAFMVGRHTLKLGILAFEYGFAEKASVGSDPPIWALRAFMSVLVPNLHVKYQFLSLDPVWVAAQAAAYYANISDRVSGHLLDVPLTLWVSVKVHPRIYLHGEGAFTYVKATGTGNVTNAELGGAAAAQTGQAQLMAQFRLTRIFSLTALGRYQFYTADLVFNGSSTLDPYTTSTVNGQLTPAVQHPWEAIGGVAVLWKHFHMILGAGYGNYFAPGINIANPKKTFVPDASLAVVF